jgi:ribokinase
MKINVLAAQYAKTKGKIVMLDCGGRDDAIPDELMRELDIISPNETEILRIDPNINMDDPIEEVRSKIISKYKNLKVLLKLGSKGSSLITDKFSIHCDVVSVINPSILTKYKIIDTVGAGDCFTSAFCVKMLEAEWKDESKWEDNYR